MAASVQLQVLIALKAFVAYLADKSVGCHERFRGEGDDFRIWVWCSRKVSLPFHGRLLLLMAGATIHHYRHTIGGLLLQRSLSTGIIISVCTGRTTIFFGRGRHGGSGKNLREEEEVRAAT